MLRGVILVRIRPLPGVSKTPTGCVTIRDCDTPPPPKKKNCCRVITRAARHMAGVISHIYDLLQLI